MKQSVFLKQSVFVATALVSFFQIAGAYKVHSERDDSGDSILASLQEYRKELGIQEKRVGAVGDLAEQIISTGRSMEHRVGPHAQLALALPMALFSISGFTGTIQLANLGGSGPTALAGEEHAFGVNGTADLYVLYDSLDGFFDVLREALGEQADTFCPKRAFGVLKQCLNMALCLVQKDVDQGYTWSTTSALRASATRRLKSGLQQTTCQSTPMTEPYQLNTAAMEWRNPRDLNCCLLLSAWLQYMAACL